MPTAKISASIDSNAIFIKDKDGINKDIFDVFTNDNEFKCLILFLINKGIINLDEFNDFKESLSVADKLDKA